MSTRKPDQIDEDIIAALHVTGLMARDACKKFGEMGDQRKAEGYRRVGQMLEGMVNKVRDPLLVALWERTGTGSNVRVEWANELTRRDAAMMAVYLLLKHDGQKLAPACKSVARLTGESFDTLRKPFKGLILPDYERSPAGAHILRLLENVRRLVEIGRAHV